MIYRILRHIAFWAHRHRIDWLGDPILRVCCPYPTIDDDDWSAKACIKAGHCGCNNKPRD